MNWAVGDPVYALGNPRGLEGTFSAGNISATRDVDGVRYLQITAPISPGSSGGPILSAEGEVVAVATASLRNSQNLNFGVSAERLTSLLNSKQAEISLSAFAPRQEEFEKKQKQTETPLISKVVLRDFHWPYDAPFSLTVFNGLDRTIRRIVVVVSFLNTEMEPAETKVLETAGPIRPQAATRVSSSVDPSVWQVNRLDYSLLSLLFSGKREISFKVGTNAVVRKLKPVLLGSGAKKVSYLINGKSANDDDFSALLKTTQEAMRVMRVVSFEFADDDRS